MNLGYENVFSLICIQFSKCYIYIIKGKNKTKYQGEICPKVEIPISYKEVKSSLDYCNNAHFPQLNKGK